MNTAMAPIVIIGTGLAGYTLAREFRKFDTETPLTLISQDDGSAYSKPQLSTALTQNKTASALANSTAETMAKRLNAQVLAHTKINAIDHHNKCILTHDARPLPYSKLVLALGARQILPTLSGNAVTDIHTINNLKDYTIFRDKLDAATKVTIIGAGFIGCEFANDLSNKNIKVDIVSLSAEPFDHLLPEEIGRSLRLALTNDNITWYRRCSATHVNHSENNDFQILLSNNTSLTSQLVLSATGLTPNIQLARDAGINTQRGIITNDLLETNISNIYALGDCLELNGQVLPFVMPLMHQARALAKTLTGNPTSLSYPVMPLIVKTPSQPIAAVLPKPEIHGQWKIETNGQNVRALYYDDTGSLHGFALSGNATKEKMALLKNFS